jgi:uncharacterized protein (DUF3084 family)
VSESKPECRSDQSSTSGIMLRNRSNTAAASETLRIGAAAGAAGKGEERISLFWRVFGGTLLSIAALVVVTVYQQFSNSLFELRNDMIHLNESRADLLRKDEFNTRMNAVWGSMKDLQTAEAPLTALRERSALLEQQLKAAEDERKELTRQLQQMRERLAVVEGRVKGKSTDTGD